MHILTHDRREKSMLRMDFSQPARAAGAQSDGFDAVFHFQSCNQRHVRWLLQSLSCIELLVVKQKTAHTRAGPRVRHDVESRQP